MIAADKDNDRHPARGDHEPHARRRSTAQELFGRRCGLCHTLKAANAVARVGPDLDQLAPNEKFVLDAILRVAPTATGRCRPRSTRAKTRKT